MQEGGGLLSYIVRVFVLWSLESDRMFEEVDVRPRSPRGQPTKRDSCFLQIAYSCEDIVDSAESIKLVSIASSAFPYTGSSKYGASLCESGSPCSCYESRTEVKLTLHGVTALFPL